MITITIYQSGNEVTGFRCLGHSGYADAGKDIICAGVSSIVINTINSIETFTEDTFQIETDEKSGLIDFQLRQTSHDSRLLLDSMLLGLKGIQRDYGNEYIVLNVKEV